MNRAILLGRLAANPELRQTASGKSVATFSIAVQKKRDEAIFIDIVCWDRTADFAAQYLSKGRQIVVDGRIDVRKYQDRDGNSRRAFEIIADRLYFADSHGVRSEAAPPPDYQPPTAPPAGFEPVPFEMEDSNLPF